MTAVAFTVIGRPAPQGSKDQFGNEANKRTKPWRAAVADKAAAALDGKPLLDGPLEVAVRFYFPRPKSHFHTSKARAGELRADAPGWFSSMPDSDKLARAVGDSLSGTCIRDDRLIARWVIEKHYGEPARAVIAVAQLAPPTQEGDP